MILFFVLISIVIIGMVILFKNRMIVYELEEGYYKLWLFFEILLFVLVGIFVDVNYVISVGFMLMIVLMIVLVFRMIGVYVFLLFINLNIKEKVFLMISYILKVIV